ncbi:ABC transporter substrate-binding protein [Bordetella bronchialis]|uniref:ABC transporter substrate-binding protein n=1 Tax=Bordetella bronchialis TaxID=463025 RepID=UPI003D086317
MKSLPSAQVALAAFFLTAAGVAQAASYVISEPADIRSTNPGVNRDDTTDGVVLNMVEGLVGYRANGSVGPLLARSVDVSADGLTYTFTLRDGVRFHNGDTLTSADVMWSWQRYMDPATDWRCRSEFDGRNGLKVEEVSAPDARTFVMKLNRKSAVFLDTLARTDCGMTAILSKASVKADGSWDKPVGTGPFMFGEWKRGEYIVLKAFKDYVSPPGDKADGYLGNKKPLVDEVKFLVVPDASTVKAGLLSGAIDAGQIPYTDVPELKSQKQVRIQVASDSAKHTLLFQTRDPLLKNVKLRQAIAASLDIPQIVQAATEGLGTPNASAVSRDSAFYDKVQEQAYRYDPALAQKLLKEAGYKGEKIVIYANKRAHVPSYQVAVMAQAMMQAVGINAQIEVLEWATQLDRYNKGNYQISSFSYSSRLDPALSYEQFSGNKDKQPRKVWDDPQAQALIDESFSELDPARRQAIFDKLHPLMLAQAPLILLSNGNQPWGVSKRLTGFTVWEGKPFAWGAKVSE